MRTGKVHALRGKSNSAGISGASPRKLNVHPSSQVLEIGQAVRGQSWQPGQLHPNLPWTHL